MKFAIVLPGIMGSELSVTGRPLVHGNVAWLNAGNLATYGPQLLQLKSDGVSPTHSGFNFVPGPNDVLGYVLPLLRAIQRAGWAGALLHYDWRKSLRNSAAKLAIDIGKAVAAEEEKQGQEASEISCVAHSMGGLLARLVYPRVNPAIRERWQTTVFLGTPHGGAYEACNVLNQQGEWWRMAYANYLQSVLVDAWQLLHSVTLLEMVRSWPSVFELLPRAEPDEFSEIDPLAAACLDPANYLNADQDFELNITAAAATWQDLNDARETEPPKQLSVYSTGKQTLTSVREVDTSGKRFTFNVSTAGDGKVAALRAVLSGTTPIEIPGVGHEVMPRDPRVLSHIEEWLAPDPQEEEVIPQQPAPIISGGGRIGDALTPASPVLIAPFPVRDPAGSNRIIHGDP